jgi:hypothetical protein
MSVPVELTELRDAIAKQAGFAYVMTVSDEQRAHAVALVPELRGNVLVCEGGNTTCRNASARPVVSLVWPPRTERDFSLIVDGDATVAGNVITITPTRAVFHRAAGCAPVSLEQ